MFPDKTICRFMFSGLALVWVLSATAARVSADEAQMSASPPQPDQAAPPAPASGSAASLPAPAPGSASSIQPAVVPCGSVTEVSAGPLLEARKVLFNRLNLARKEGIGVGAYMAEFARIEEAVRNGDAPERLQPRIASLARSLKEQLDRREVLKTQRPIPAPAAHAISDSPNAAAQTSTASGGGDRTSAIIDKIKEKLKDGDIPDGLKEKFLNSDQGRKILEKLGR